MVGTSKFSPHEKAEVILMGLKSPGQISEICRKHNISPVTYAKWKKRYINGGLEAMKPGYKSEIDDIEKETLKLKTIIGELYVELEYLKKKLGMEK
jgi:transposase-like protein